MDKRQRAVAFLHEDFPFGGGERVTLNLAPYFAAQGYGIYIFALRLHPELWPAGTEKILQAYALPDTRRINSRQNAVYLAQALKESGIGIFVSISSGFRSFDILRKASPGCRFIFALHFQPFCEIQFKEERLLRNRKKASGLAKWILIDFLKYRILRRHHTRWHKIYRQLYRQTDAYVVLCKGYKEEIIRTLHLKSPTRLYAIGNSTELPPQPNLKKEKQVLFAGRMSHADKRIDRLIRIWAKTEKAVPDWRLILAGDGPERARLEQQARGLGLKRASFAGYQQDLAPLYEQSAVVCLTSSFEGWPLCLTEGQAHGVIPMAFDCSEGIKAICGGGGCGLLVEPFDEDAYAEALIALLRDAPRRKALQLKALQKAQDYSIERIGAQWMDLFKHLNP